MKGRIVVKIGSQVLCGEQGDLNLDVLGQLVGQIGRLAADGWQVLLVSSGAVAAGHGVAADRLSEAGIKLVSEAIPAQDNVLSNLDQFYQLQLALAGRATSDARRTYLSTREWMLGLALGALEWLRTLFVNFSNESYDVGQDVATSRSVVPGIIFDQKISDREVFPARGRRIGAEVRGAPGAMADTGSKTAGSSS